MALTSWSKLLSRQPVKAVNQARLDMSMRNTWLPSWQMLALVLTAVARNESPRATFPPPLPLLLAPARGRRERHQRRYYLKITMISSKILHVCCRWCAAIGRRVCRNQEVWW